MKVCVPQAVYDPGGRDGVSGLWLIKTDDS